MLHDFVAVELKPPRVPPRQKLPLSVSAMLEVLAQRSFAM
jgi:hypothetical protein